MKIAVAGSTGVLGINLLPKLIKGGHSVLALCRSLEKAKKVLPENVNPVECDLLLPGSTKMLPDLLKGCDVVIHIATSIPKNFNVSGAWDVNTRLRIEGTRILLDASLQAGVKRYIQQSIIMAYKDGGDKWIDENFPLDNSPGRAPICSPVIKMENIVRDVSGDKIEWAILRGGTFVGPGTSQKNTIINLKEGRGFIPCNGNSYISPIHVSDVSSAYAIAVGKAPQPQHLILLANR